MWSDEIISLQPYSKATSPFIQAWHKQLKNKRETYIHRCMQDIISKCVYIRAQKHKGGII